MKMQYLYYQCFYVAHQAFLTNYGIKWYELDDLIWFLEIRWNILVQSKVDQSFPGNLRDNECNLLISGNTFAKKGNDKSIPRKR